MKKSQETQFKILSTGDEILPPLVRTSVNEIVEKEGYIKHEIINKAISTRGGGLMGELYAVDIKGITEDGDQQTYLFIKNKINDAHVTILDVGKCYRTENFFYGEISKLYDDIQIKANILEEERFAIVKSYDAVSPDVIVLENLAKKGFITVHRMDVVPLKFAQLSIQQLARFHGLSWVLENQYPEYYAKKIRTLTTTLKFNEDYQNFIANMSKYVDKCVNDEKKTKLNNFYCHIMQNLKNYYAENTGLKCCLCHGDYRTNNILVQKNGDIITYAIPVDYQFMYYGCPVMDFLYFIFSGTDQEFRKKHLDDLKKLYYDSLAKFLEYFNINVESVYPRQEFETEYKKRLDFGLIMGLVMTPLLFTGDDDVPDLSEDDFTSVSVTPDLKMDERIRGLIDDFEKWGVL